MLVFIGNLSWTTTEDDIKTFVGNVGSIVSITIKRHSDTQRSKGWG